MISLTHVTLMKRAIRFGQRYARKGRGQPFVVFYFLPVLPPHKAIAYFAKMEAVDVTKFIHHENETFALYLPFAPLLTPALKSALQTMNLSHIAVGVKHPEVKDDWETFAKAHQIAFITGVAEAEARQFNEVFLYQHHNKRPFVALSYGMSVDGKIATKTGDSRYISGPQTRVFVHQLRDYYQAILVGINTVRIDHPKLTARLSGRQALDPDKIVLDSHLSMALDEPVITSSRNARTIVVTLKGQDEHKKVALQKLGVLVIETEASHGRIDLVDALNKLYALGIDSIFVEGGSTVHYSFIEANLFNLIYAYISPIIIGGKTAPSAVGGEGFAYLKEAASIHFEKIHRLGSDIVVVMRPAKKG